MKKLTDLKNGQKAKISAINGDRRYLSRITSIGLSIGCPVEMLQNEKSCPILVYGRDTMIALNKDESNRRGANLFSSFTLSLYTFSIGFS